MLVFSPPAKEVQRPRDSRSPSGMFLYVIRERNLGQPLPVGLQTEARLFTQDCSAGGKVGQAPPCSQPLAAVTTESKHILSPGGCPGPVIMLIGWAKAGLQTARCQGCLISHRTSWCSFHLQTCVQLREPKCTFDCFP